MSVGPLDAKISPHFSRAEFECHDGTDVPDNYMPNLIRLISGVLGPVRLFAGCPISVISGYRTPDYNKRIGGAKDSAHMTAEAADIRGTRNMSAAELHRLILSLHGQGKLPDLGGLGVYKTWCHVDVRKAADGHLRRWAGNGVGSEK